MHGKITENILYCKIVFDFFWKLILAIGLNITVNDCFSALLKEGSKGELASNLG
jgi:hypothetical protein